MPVVTSLYDKIICYINCVFTLFKVLFLMSEEIYPLVVATALSIPIIFAL